MQHKISNTGGLWNQNPNSWKFPSDRPMYLLFLSSSERILEKAMLKCVLKPLKPAISSALKEFQVRSGTWKELKDNLSLARARRPQEIGVADALPPDPVAIEKIRQKFQTMCKLYSPEKKVCMLLRVCKLIYTIMEDNSGEIFEENSFL